MSQPESITASPVIWVNQTRTLLVTLWEDGTMTVAERDTAGDIWGPPRLVEMEQPR